MFCLSRGTPSAGDGWRKRRCGRWWGWHCHHCPSLLATVWQCHRAASRDLSFYALFSYHGDGDGGIGTLCVHRLVVCVCLCSPSFSSPVAAAVSCCPRRHAYGKRKYTSTLPRSKEEEEEEDSTTCLFPSFGQQWQRQERRPSRRRRQREEENGRKKKTSLSCFVVTRLSTPPAAPSRLLPWRSYGGSGSRLSAHTAAHLARLCLLSLSYFSI